MEAKVGEYIKVTTDKGEHRGIVMPRPKLAAKDHIILKLDSGYNMGISESRIKSIEKLAKKEKNEPSKKISVKQDPRLPTVDFLGCGGTIASKVDYETGGVKWAMEPSEIFSTVPELTSITNIGRADLLFNIFSESMTPTHWIKMAKEAKGSLDSGADGVVLLHGTDTMGYSSAALSFMLSDLSGPVILTGSQRSSDRGSSDSALNLICSSIGASSDLGEVCVCMHKDSSDGSCLAHRGVRVRKMHTSRRNAFCSINSSPLLEIFPNGKIEKLSDYRKRGGGNVLSGKFEEKIALVKSHPGSSEIIDFYTDKGFAGLVVEATGLGQVPESWSKAIIRAIESGIHVVFSAQTIGGRLNPYVYEPARKMKSAGVIYAEDMLSETAYVKLGWLLGCGLDPRTEMTKNYCGEISLRSEEREYR